jgi:hypothetical protein
MAEEQDGWFEPFGFDPGKVAAAVQETASSAVQAVSQTASAAVETVENTASSALPAVSNTPAPAMQAAMPQPAPGIVEEFEEGVVSGVRTVARVIPKAAEVAEGAVEVAAEGAAVGGLAEAGVAVAAVAVGLGTVLAVATAAEYPDQPVEENPGDPDNPKYGHGEGGAPEQTSSNPTAQPVGGGGDAGAQETDPAEAGVRDRIKQGNAQRQAQDMSNEENVQHDPDREVTCESIWPQYRKCSECRHRFDNLKDAEKAALGGRTKGPVNASTMPDYAGFSDAENGHLTYYEKENPEKEMFSLLRLPCCKQIDKSPVLIWKWEIVF